MAVVFWYDAELPALARCRVPRGSATGINAVNFQREITSPLGGYGSLKAIQPETPVSTYYYLNPVPGPREVWGKLVLDLRQYVLAVGQEIAQPLGLWYQGTGAIQIIPRLAGVNANQLCIAVRNNDYSNWEPTLSTPILPSGHGWGDEPHTIWFYIKLATTETSGDGIIKVWIDPPETPPWGLPPDAQKTDYQNCYPTGLSYIAWGDIQGGTTADAGSTTILDDIIIWDDASATTVPDIPNGGEPFVVAVTADATNHTFLTALERMRVPFVTADAGNLPDPSSNFWTGRKALFILSYGTTSDVPFGWLRGDAPVPTVVLSCASLSAVPGLGVQTQGGATIYEWALPSGTFYLQSNRFAHITDTDTNTIIAARPDAPTQALFFVHQEDGKQPVAFWCGSAEDPTASPWGLGYTALPLIWRWLRSIDETIPGEFIAHIDVDDILNGTTGEEVTTLTDALRALGGKAYVGINTDQVARNLCEEGAVAAVAAGVTSGILLPFIHAHGYPNFNGDAPEVWRGEAVSVNDTTLIAGLNDTFTTWGSYSDADKALMTRLVRYYQAGTRLYNLSKAEVVTLAAPPSTSGDEYDVPVTFTLTQAPQELWVTGDTLIVVPDEYAMQALYAFHRDIALEAGIPLPERPRWMPWPWNGQNEFAYAFWTMDEALNHPLGMRTSVYPDTKTPRELRFTIASTGTLDETTVPAENASTEAPYWPHTGILFNLNRGTTRLAVLREGGTGARSASLTAYRTLPSSDDWQRGDTVELVRYPFYRQLKYEGCRSRIVTAHGITIVPDGEQPMSSTQTTWADIPGVTDAMKHAYLNARFLFDLNLGLPTYIHGDNIWSHDTYDAPAITWLQGLEPFFRYCGDVIRWLLPATRP